MGKIPSRCVGGSPEWQDPHDADAYAGWPVHLW